MRDQLDRFGDARVAAVTFATQDRLAAHREHLALPFPLLADPDRAIYQQFDLGRATFRHVYNPGTLLLYGRLLRQGRKLRRPSEDTRQLGGDFVIDRSGLLVQGFWPRSPDDRPSVHQLIEAVGRARNSSSPEDPGA